MYLIWFFLYFNGCSNQEWLILEPEHPSLGIIGVLSFIWTVVMSTAWSEGWQCTVRLFSLVISIVLTHNLLQNRINHNFLFFYPRIYLFLFTKPLGVFLIGHLTELYINCGTVLTGEAVDSQWCPSTRVRIPSAAVLRYPILRSSRI